MSNRDPDVRYENLAQELDFDFQQKTKTLIHTALPGIVRHYDARTKRARVQPALRMLFTDGTPAKEKPPILNVPVRQTATGAHMMHQQLDVGDVVLLVFNERGLEKFKQNWGTISDPTQEGFFAEKDAWAIPWGVENIEPVRSTGWLIQNASGTCYVSVDDDTIRMATGNSSFTLTPTSVNVRAGTITLQGDTDTLVIP